MKKAIRILAIVLIIASLSSTAAFAATQSNAYISYYNAAASSDGNGNVRIDFGVCGTDTMATLGASKVRIYTEDGMLVAVFYSANELYAADMLGSNRLAFYGHVTYEGTPGQAYYAIVTVYASDGVGSGTENYLTNTVVA